YSMNSTPGRPSSNRCSPRPITQVMGVSGQALRRVCTSGSTWVTSPSADSRSRHTEAGAGGGVGNRADSVGIALLDSLDGRLRRQRKPDAIRMAARRARRTFRQYRVRGDSVRRAAFPASHARLVRSRVVEGACPAGGGRWSRQRLVRGCALRARGAPPLPARRVAGEAEPRPLPVARRRSQPRLRGVPADPRAAHAGPAGAAADRRRLLAPRPDRARGDPGRAAGRDPSAGPARRGIRQPGTVGKNRQAAVPVPSRRAGPRRPQCPQRAVRRTGARLADRLRPERAADPGDRLARSQPGAAAAFAAEAARRARPGGGGTRLRSPLRRLPRRLGARHLMDAGNARWRLRFHGVGNSHATALGSAMATIERDGAPWLAIDCGSEGLSAYLDHYGAMPRALFV